MTLNKTAGQTLSVGGSTTALTITGSYTQTQGNFTAPATLTVGGNTTLTAGTFTAGSNVSVAGNWTNNGATFVFAGAGAVTFIGNSSQINGTVASQTFTNLTLNKTAGQTLSVGGSTTALTITGAYTQTQGNFTAPATLTVGGNTTLTAGTFTAGANVSVAGNWTNNGATFTPGTGTVTFTGNTSTIGGSVAPTFQNLTINKTAGNLQNLGVGITVSNLLTLTSGQVDIGSHNLTFGVNALPVAGAFSSSNMIVATGTGQVRKINAANGIFLFPIGDATGTAEYSPITINFVSGTYAVGAFVGVNVTNAKHPNNSSITNFLNRFWTVSQTGITAFNANVSATYVTADIVGSESGQIAASYNGSLPWLKYSVLASNTLTANGLSAFGSFTGINNTPLLSVNPTSLTGFSYPLTAGPSSIQSFTVSGTELIENVSVQSSTSFEVSLTGGASFSGQPFVTVPVSAGSVNQLVYVRMKAGLPLGVKGPETLILSSSGAINQVVSVTGNVTAQSLITVTPTSLSGFSATYGGTASAAQNFTISGANLLADITITAPAGFEIKTSAQTVFVNSLTLTRSGTTVASTTMNVRLKAGLGVGSYTGNVVATSIFAENKTVAITGSTVVPVATITTNVSWLASFIYTLGNANPPSQTFQVNGSNLTADIVLSVPTGPQHFQLSLNGTTWSNTVTLIRTGNSVNSALVYARLNTGLAVASYGPTNVTITSAGAVVKTVALSGQVVNAATILVSRTSLTGFGYLFGSGPSASQSVTVSGASLSQNITVNCPANYQISTDNVTFGTNAISLVPTSGTVPPTHVFYRLAANLAAATYNTSLNVVSTGATTRTINLFGKVYATPLITSTGGGDYCIGNTVQLTSSGTDVESRYWTGPNGYYSTLNNPSLTNITQGQAGTYTVTGNVVVGGELIVNGDFEMGNTGFGSSYTYVAPVASALNPEGLYTITPFASTVHTNFNSVADRNVIGANQMIINGNVTAGAVVWSQSVSVLQNSNYQFSYWLQTVVNGTDPAPSKLQLYVNGVMAGPIYTANPTSGVWTQYLYNTSSNSNTILNLELINQTIAAGGNDFALDSISFRQVLNSSSSQVVNVSPPVTASVDVTYSPTTVYVNAPVVYTATPVNGGTTPTYKWFVNGVEQVGQTASTFTFTPTTTAQVTVRSEMTSSITCATPKPALDTEVITPQNIPANYWMGGIDTDWGKPGNWTANYVPATGDNVIYATVANFGTAAVRDLQLDINRTIGSLINATIRRLIIPAGLTLYVNNIVNVTPPVTNPVTLAEDLILIRAASSITANGSLIYNNPQNQPVFGTVEMFSPASWNLANAVNNRFNWQYFGIPVESVAALPTFFMAYVRQRLESGTTISNHWQQLTNESVLQPFIGYELCQQAPKFYTFKGQLINRNFQSIQFQRTAGALSPGQYLFGNPYTSAIDIRQIEFGENIEETAYLYNTGSFQSWVDGVKSSQTTNVIPGQFSSAPKDQAGNSGILRQVPSMGTFMARVRVGFSPTINSKIGLNYSNVRMGNADRQRMKAQSITDEQSATTLLVEGKFGADRMWLMSHENYTRNFDSGLDGVKVLGLALNPQLYAVEDDGKYQINSIDNIHNTTIAFQAGIDTDYTLTIAHNEQTRSRYSKILLHDLVENVLVDITADSTVYAFKANSTPQAVNRFKIIASNKLDAEQHAKPNVKFYAVDRKAYIQNFEDADAHVQVYDLSGRMLIAKTISKQSNAQLITPIQKVFIVKITSAGKSFSDKIVLQ